jgi:hypothetical protein
MVEIPPVRDPLGLVHNVILIECIFGSGKPRGGGILGEGGTGTIGGTKGVSLRATGSRGGRILSQRGGFQVSEQGEQGNKGLNCVHMMNCILYM